MLLTEQYKRDFLSHDRHRKEKLKIVMLDKMKIYQKGTVTEIKEPEIGLHTGRLCRIRRYKCFYMQAISDERADYSDSEKNMSVYADQNHALSLTCVRLERI